MRTLVALLLLPSLAAATAGEPEAAAPAEPLGPAQILGRLVEEHAGDPKSDLAREVRKLEQAPAAVFEALATGRVALPEGEPLAVEGDVEGALLAVAALLPRREAMQAATAATDPAVAELTPGVHRAFQTFVRLVGTEGDLSASTRLFERAQVELGDPSTPATGRQRPAEVYQGTVEGVLRRIGTPALTSLVPVFSAAKTEVRVHVVRAVSRAGGVAGRRWLLDRLGIAAELDLPILSELARPMPLRVPLLGADLERLSRYLLDSDYQLRREAARVALRHGSSVVLESLIHTVNDEVPEVRAVTVDALHAITGLRLGEGSSRWSEWLQGEEEWYEADGERLVARLSDANPRVVEAVLEVLVTHHYRRDETAREVAALLDGGNAQLALLACHALERLASPTALAPLVACFDADDEALAQAAYAAAKAVSGRDLPPESDLWRTELALELPE